MKALILLFSLCFAHYLNAQDCSTFRQGGLTYSDMRIINQAAKTRGCPISKTNIEEKAAFSGRDASRMTGNNYNFTTVVLRRAGYNVTFSDGSVLGPFWSLTGANGAYSWAYSESPSEVASRLGISVGWRNSW